MCFYVYRTFYVHWHLYLCNRFILKINYGKIRRQKLCRFHANQTIYRTYLYVHVHVPSMCRVFFCVLHIQNALMTLFLENKIQNHCVLPISASVEYFWFYKLVFYVPGAFPCGLHRSREGSRVLKLQNEWQMINKYVCLSWYQLIWQIFFFTFCR